MICKQKIGGKAMRKIISFLCAIGYLGQLCAMQKIPSVEEISKKLKIPIWPETTEPYKPNFLDRAIIQTITKKYLLWTMVKNTKKHKYRLTEKDAYFAAHPEQTKKARSQSYVIYLSIHTKKNEYNKIIWNALKNKLEAYLKKEKKKSYKDYIPK